MLHFDVQSSTMSDRLTSTQIRAARAMLGWSMVALAKASQVAVSTMLSWPGSGTLSRRRACAFWPMTAMG